MCPRMSSSLDDQRHRGLLGRNESVHPTSWVGRHVTRRVSPYVTWLFLRLGISANQCTLLRLILSVGVAAMFAMPGAWWWMGAVVARYGTVVLDCVDGELARIRGTSSPEGTYFDDFACHVGWVLGVAGMACGLYRGLGGLHVVVIGLVATVGMMLTMSHLPLVRAVAYEWGVTPEVGAVGRQAPPEFVSKLGTAARVLLVMPGLHYLPHVLVASALDAFVPSFTLFGLVFNVRLLWMALFAAGTVAAAMARCGVTMRHGLRTQL